MQNKNELKKKMMDKIESIKANSKDAHFANELISDLLSLKGQLMHEPTLVHVPVSEIADTFDGETFTMNVMRDGTAVYHVKGGMDIVCKPNLSSLNGTIVSLIEDSKRYDEMSKEEKEAFDTEMQATAYVLNVPMIAFSDIDFMFDTASSVVKFIGAKFDESMNQELQDETTLEDKQFEDATTALELLKEESKKKEDA